MTVKTFITQIISIPNKRYLYQNTDNTNNNDYYYYYCFSAFIYLVYFWIQIELQKIMKHIFKNDQKERLNYVLFEEVIINRPLNLKKPRWT